MSELYNEIPLSAAALESTAQAAMSSMGLSPGNFAALLGETKSEDPNATRGRVTYYGGRVVNNRGDFCCGHILAAIGEPIPEGALHAPDRKTKAEPFITRLFRAHRNLIKVETPTLTPSPKDGPLVVIGKTAPHFQNTTIYNMETGDLEIKTGEYDITDPTQPVDNTTLQNLLDQPDEVIDRRLATLNRTIRAVTSIFDKIATLEEGDVRWRIHK